MTNTPAGDTRPHYDEGWRAAVVYFGLISFGFAQPLFETINIFRPEFYFGLSGAFIIVFVFQYLAAAVLAAVMLAVSAQKLRRALDLVIIPGACLMLLRQMQIFYFNTFSADVLFGAKLITAAAAAAVLAAGVFVFHRTLKMILFYIGVISPVFGVLFIYTMMTHDVPLAAPEQAPAREAAHGAAPGPAVIVALMDELSLNSLLGPGGDIDADAFPNFARLAARGVWWKNAIANYSRTTYAFPSLVKSEFMTAQNQIKFLNTLEHDGLFGAFGDAGYKIHAYSDYFACGNGRLICENFLSARNPNFLRNTLIKFFDVFRMNFMHGRFFPSFYKLRLDAQHAHLIETVKTARPGTFHFVHMFSTHQPFFLDAECASVRSPKTAAFGPGDDFEAIAADSREQLRCTDLVTGEMMDAADSRADESGQAPPVFMLISDHGNCWSDACPGRLAVDSIRVIEPSLVNIPVMLLSPFHKPRVDEDDFQLIDLAPTLCEAAGLKGCGDYGFEGVSRLTNSPPPRPRRFYLTPDRPVDIPLPARPVPAPPAQSS